VAAAAVVVEVVEVVEVRKKGQHYRE